LRHIGEAVIGIMLATTPVFLWIAWTPEILIGVMLASVLCAGVLVLLTESSPDQAAGSAQRTLPPEFIDEVHQLFPLTYHHSRHETPRFRRAMQKMSRMIR